MALAGTNNQKTNKNIGWKALEKPKRKTHQKDKEGGGGHSFVLMYTTKKVIEEMRKRGPRERGGWERQS